jgi:hypothetical protein
LRWNGLLETIGKASDMPRCLLPKIVLEIYLPANDISRCTAAEVPHVR